VLQLLIILVNFIPTKEEEWLGKEHPRDHLNRNLRIHGNSEPTKVIEEDFFSINMSTIKDVDVFFYDGGHDYDSQYKALKYALQSLADTFLFIVDDYHWPEVNKGTKDGIKELINSGENNSSSSKRITVIYSSSRCMA
jgi:hypothetical protein